MKLFFTRHGHTKGNLEARYVGGASDEPLCAEGLRELRQIPPITGAKRVYVSPLLRTLQTAAILYPGAKPCPLPALREMEFGAFEGKNWRELENDPIYRAWVEGGCTGLCPGGEDRQGFVKRCLSGYRTALSAEAGQEEVHFVIHGGTIMALLGHLAKPSLDYFKATTPPGGRWLCQGDENSLTILQRPEEPKA